MKNIRVLLVFTLIVIMMTSVTAENVNAQKFRRYTSGITVQNVSVGDAAIEINFFYGDDSADAGGIAHTIAIDVLGSYEVVDYITIPVSSFKGSVVISSDAPLASVSTLRGDNKGRGMYTGFTSGSQEVVLPFMMRNWGASSWDTYFSVQNVGASDATVNINYASCGPGIDNTITVKPNAMKIVNQGIEPCMQGKVITSAILTSNEPIVVVVSQESTKVNSALVSSGYDRGSTHPVIPLVNSNNPTKTDWRTAISFFNLGAVETTVKLEYVRKDGFICHETRSIAPNGSTEFGGNAFILGSPALTCPTGGRFIGAAHVVENSGNVPLVATVNQDRGTLASAYSSFNMEDGTPRIAFPQFLNRYGGAEAWDSTFTVMNVGTNPVYVQCEYLNASYTSNLGAIEPKGVREDLPKWNLPANYAGAGWCTAYSDSAYSTIDYSASIVGIVNTRGHGVGFNDLMMTYEAINVDLVP